MNGLEDYTTDQRGDVGSWVRLASIAGLRHIIDAFRAQASQLRPPESWLPPGLFHSIVGGVTKQLVERIDTVRADAGEHLLHIYRSAPVVDIWIPENVQLVLEVFPRCVAHINFQSYPVLPLSAHSSLLNLWTSWYLVLQRRRVEI